MVILLTSCKKAEKEIHLIPAGYTGVVTIVFDCATGDKVQYEEGARVYRINAEGILKISSPFNKGLLKPGEQLFYYIDSSGHRTEIMHHKETNKKAESKNIMIFNMQFHGNCFVNGQELTNSAVQYLVCSEEEREKFYKKAINPCSLYCN